MHWFFTVVLIVACAGTVAFTGYLLHRLFTTAPDAVAALTAPAESAEEHTG